MPPRNNAKDPRRRRRSPRRAGGRLADREGSSAGGLANGRPRRGKQAKRAGPLFEKLVALQARLRAPGGCPWDREQTHASLRTYLIEEAYEVLDALESGDAGKFAEELGDLLLQVIFHAEIAREDRRFDIGEVIERVHTKMVRRHPHVFGKDRLRTSAQVLEKWEHLKAAERAEDAAASGKPAEVKNGGSLLEGLPRNLPALLEAYQLTRRAARIGFDWEHIDGVFDKLREETEELRDALERPESARTEEEVGDLLFSAVNIARFLGVDPEIALKRANRKFKARFQQMEQEAAHSGRALAKVPREEMENLWDASKSSAEPGSPAPANARGAAQR